VKVRVRERRRIRRIRRKEMLAEVGYAARFGEVVKVVKSGCLSGI